MEIVIDIDEDVFTRLFDNGIQDNEIAVDDVCEMARALRLGTPLPEHHGRLIDADELHHKMGEWLKPQKADESVMVALDDIAISTMMEIEDAPTIIEGSESE